MQYDASNPLIIQGDRSVLVEVDNPRYAEARDALAPFAELEKSPEHIHTYRLTPLSLWNAAAAGLTADAMIEVLRRFSKFPLPSNLTPDITELVSRYGRVRLERQTPSPDPSPAAEEGTEMPAPPPLRLVCPDVPLLEEHPAQAARINVLGTYDLCRLCTDLGVGVFVFVSSDKAADPVNVLGASKRLGELIVQAMASGSGGGTTRFCAVRFGNVIGSRGSVVPTFVRQLEHGGPVTVTDARATRYFMTIAEACGLVILTATVSDAGGTYLLDMGAPVRIAELAEKIIRLRGLRVDVDVPIAYTGLRAGERLHEVLLGAGESLGDGPHPKVARIAGLNGPPARRAVAAWARELRAGLDGDEVWLRQRLLELSHGGAASPPPERAGTAGAGRRPAVSRRV